MYSVKKSPSHLWSEIGAKRPVRVRVRVRVKVRVRVNVRVRSQEGLGLVNRQHSL